MKKLIYLLVIVVLLWVGWMVWENMKKAPVNGYQFAINVNVDSTDFKSATSPTLGKYLQASNGMTLYTFKNDSPKTSACTGACLEKWPAYTPATEKLSKLPQNIGKMTRTDGTTQFTWVDMPLYFYSGDKVPGDANGQEFNNSWFIVKL